MLGRKERIRRCAEKLCYWFKVCQGNLTCAVALLVIVKVVSRQNKHKRTHLARHFNALIFLEPMRRNGNGYRKSDTLHLPKIADTLGKYLRLTYRSR